MNISDLQSYIVPGRRCHMVGIGGVSMSPLAEVLFDAGICVSGSDINESATVLHLREKGIPVVIGHFAENVEGVDFVVRTAAARDDNPEIAAARAAGIPVFERAQAWGFIMRAYKNALCISGTHGKTTTTSMSTHILMAAEKDPTVMIGGTLPLLGAGHRVGHGNTIVMESCEYFNSFLSFSPTVAVILNIEEDHLDFFKDLADIQASFRKFASLVPETGTVVYNGEDANTLQALAGLDRKMLSFGFGEGVDVRAVNLERDDCGSDFDVLYKGELFTHVKLQIPGRYNVLNALAATAAAISLGIAPEAVSRGLSTFAGAGRRFEFKGMCGGAKVYDDYAHHPGEIKNLLDSATLLGYARVIVAFQPHTYSRTKFLFDDFVEQLKRPDKVFLAGIYAAREKDVFGVSSADLAAQIPNAVHYDSFESLEAALKAEAKPGDLILTVGAGNIYKVGEAIIEK